MELKSWCSLLWIFQVLWKSYIDFEIEQEEYENTRNLYKRLLQRTQHVKVKLLNECRTPITLKDV